MVKNTENIIVFMASRSAIASVAESRTRVRGIRFLEFEIIFVLVYILTVFKVTDLFVKYFLFKTYMPAKKYFRKKAEKLCLIGVIFDEETTNKNQFSKLHTWISHSRSALKGPVLNLEFTSIVPFKWKKP